MTDKYIKTSSKSRKLVIYGAICFFVVAVNTVTLIYGIFSHSGEEYGGWLITPIAGFLINCFSILYCILQDIRQTCQKPQPHFVFQNKHDIPFVDREDLIEEVLSGISEKIVAHRDYYTKNIRYGIRNGKTSFAQKLCWELQCIKDQKGSDSHNFSPKVASKIGNIYLVNYTDYGDAFGTHIKTDYTYIKGKLNLIVVTNFQNVQFPWNDHLKDPDVFFVLLNFNDTSEDALFFADDKIVCLLNSLKDLPAFSSLVSGKTQDEIEAMAVKLGSLTHNSIGAIVDLLTSNEFLLLLEMDAPFVDFYLALKRGQYVQAEKLYHILPPPPPKNVALGYKMEYEKANLDHFLGRYETAYEALNHLMAQICCNSSFMDSSIGRSLYCNIVFLLSHILKHLGRFGEAASTLHQIDCSDRNAIWLRAHFSLNILQLNELVQPCSEWGELLQELKQKMKQFKEMRKLINSDYFFYEAYYPIVAFYDSHFDRALIPRLLEIEENAIAYYEVEERRYLTNCYFIKAEFLRINKQWKDAEKYYALCYDICSSNGDKDIFYIVAITCTCLLWFEDVKLDIPFDWDKALAECKQQDGYGFHRRLMSQMELSKANEEFRKSWLSHYRVTITPIP